MIYKIVTCLSIITVSAYEKEINSKHAISSQRFYREDVPLSYQFHNIHNYEPRHRLEDKYQEQKPNPNADKYPTIQYAPLVQGKRTGHETQYSVVNEQNLTPLLPKKEHHEQKTGENLENKPKYNLEPKLSYENENAHQQNYRSFLPGHNLSVFPDKTGQQEHAGQFLKSQLAKKPPKPVYYRKSTTEVIDTTPAHLTIEIHKPTMDYKLHQFSPSEQAKPIEIKPPVHNVLLTNVKPPVQNVLLTNMKPLPPVQDIQNTPGYDLSLHNQLFGEKQQQSFQHPRIHLNIARIYNIANQLQEAHLPHILLPNSLHQNDYGKPLPVRNIANSVPANIVRKQQTLVALKSPPTNSEKQTLFYAPYNPVPSNNVVKVPNLSAAFYLQKNQENTLMLPTRNLHS